MGGIEGGLWFREFLGQGHAIDLHHNCTQGEASWHLFGSHRCRILDAYLKCAELSAHITVLASRQGLPISGPMHIIRPHLPPLFPSLALYISPISRTGPQPPVSTLWSPQRKFLPGTNQHGGIPPQNDFDGDVSEAISSWWTPTWLGGHMTMWLDSNLRISVQQHSRAHA